MTYASGPVTAAQLKQVCVSDPQRGIYQHVQSGKLTL